MLNPTVVGNFLKKFGRVNIRDVLNMDLVLEQAYDCTVKNKLHYFAEFGFSSKSKLTEILKPQFIYKKIQESAERLRLLASAVG